MFLYSQWVQLSLPTRNAIADKFGILKRGSTEVFNNTIKSDGYVLKEVEEALNIDAIQKFLGTEETDMSVLWVGLVSKVENPDAYEANHPAQAAPEPVADVATPEKVEVADEVKESAPKKRATRAKKVK